MKFHTTSPNVYRQKSNIALQFRQLLVCFQSLLILLKCFMITGLLNMTSDGMLPEAKKSDCIVKKRSDYCFAAGA